MKNFSDFIKFGPATGPPRMDVIDFYNEHLSPKIGKPNWITPDYSDDGRWVEGLQENPRFQKAFQNYELYGHGPTPQEVLDIKDYAMAAPTPTATPLPQDTHIRRSQLPPMTDGLQAARDRARAMQDAGKLINVTHHPDDPRNRDDDDAIQLTDRQLGDAINMGRLYDAAHSPPRPISKPQPRDNTMSFPQQFDDLGHPMGPTGEAVPDVARMIIAAQRKKALRDATTPDYPTGIGGWGPAEAWTQQQADAGLGEPVPSPHHEAPRDVWPSPHHEAPPEVAPQPSTPPAPPIPMSPRELVDMRRPFSEDNIARGYDPTSEQHRAALAEIMAAAKEEGDRRMSGQVAGVPNQLGDARGISALLAGNGGTPLSVGRDDLAAIAEARDNASLGGRPGQQMRDSAGNPSLMPHNMTPVGPRGPSGPRIPGRALAPEEAAAIEAMGGEVQMERLAENNPAGERKILFDHMRNVINMPEGPEKEAAMAALPTITATGDPEQAFDSDAGRARRAAAQRNWAARKGLGAGSYTERMAARGDEENKRKLAHSERGARLAESRELRMQGMRPSLAAMLAGTEGGTAAERMAALRDPRGINAANMKDADRDAMRAEAAENRAFQAEQNRLDRESREKIAGGNDNDKPNPMAAKTTAEILMSPTLTPPQKRAALKSNGMTDVQIDAALASDSTGSRPINAAPDVWSNLKSDRPVFHGAAGAASKRFIDEELANVNAVRAWPDVLVPRNVKSRAYIEHLRSLDIPDAAIKSYLTSIGYPIKSPKYGSFF